MDCNTVIDDLLKEAGYPLRNKNCKVCLVVDVNLYSTAAVYDGVSNHITIKESVKNDALYTEVMKALTFLRNYKYPVPYAQVMHIKNDNDITYIKRMLDKFVNLDGMAMADIRMLSEKYNANIEIVIDIGAFSSNNIFSKLLRVNFSSLARIKYSENYLDKGNQFKTDFTAPYKVKLNDFTESNRILHNILKAERNSSIYRVNI